MTLNMYKLNADHEIDMNTFGASTIDTYVPYTSGTIYYYDSDTASFSESGSGDQYSKVTRDVFTFSSGDIHDVVAKIRTVDIIMNLIQRISTFFMYLRMGVAKQVLTDLTEETGKFRVYESNSNICETDEEEIVCYEDDRDVNAYSGDTYSRMNGTRNFIVQEIPAATRLNKSCSFEVELTNEGKLFDFELMQSERQEKGNG